MITTPQIPVDPCDLFWEVSYNNINIASGVLVRSELYVVLNYFNSRLIYIFGRI